MKVKNITPIELMFYAAFLLGYSFCMVMFIIYVDHLPVVVLYLWYGTIVLSCLMIVGRIVYVGVRKHWKAWEHLNKITW